MESPEEIKMIDIDSVVKPKPKRGRPKKKPAESAPEEPDSVKGPTEKERLKAELLRLSDYTPEVVTKPVNDKIAKLVEEMDLDELRERVRIGKRNQSSKMDNSVAVQTISLANQAVGRLLGCLEELNETSLKDKLLHESVKDYLCLNVLDFIPPEVKIGGLYGSHVVNAYANKPVPPTPKVTEIPEDIKEKLDSPEVQDKLHDLRARLEDLKA